MVILPWTSINGDNRKVSVKYQKNKINCAN